MDERLTTCLGFTFLSTISYSTLQPDMLVSPTELFGKNTLGFIDLYAHPAEPSTEDFPPPLGPINAVTGNSK